MSRITKLLTVSAALLAPWLLTSPVVADESLVVVTAISKHTLNSFDISFVDPTIGLYVLADRTNNGILMVDTHQRTFLGYCGQGQFQGVKSSTAISGPDGVLIRDSREIWAGDGDSTVKVFDVAGCDGTTSPKQTIHTGVEADKRADELCYDPVDQLILVANNAAEPPFATLISTLGPTYVPVARITFNGTNGAPKSTNGIEQCQWSPRTGLFYITVPGVKDPNTGEGVVAVISPQSQKVVNVFPIP